MLITNDLITQEIMQREMLPDEKLLWCGKPRGGFLLRPSDAFLIPFSCFWFGFAIFWETSVMKDGPFFFELWGIPFLLVGAYITVGRFFYDKENRARSYYAVTTNRVIIRSGVLKTTVESFNIRTMFNMSVSERSDGSGTIKLDSDGDVFGAFNVPGLPSRNKQVPAMEFIPDVRNVYNLILKQQHA